MTNAQRFACALDLVEAFLKYFVKKRIVETLKLVGGIRSTTQIDIMPMCESDLIRDYLEWCKQEYGEIDNDK